MAWTPEHHLHTGPLGTTVARDLAPDVAEAY